MEEPLALFLLFLRHALSLKSNFDIIVLLDVSSFQNGVVLWERRPNEH